MENNSNTTKSGPSICTIDSLYKVNCNKSGFYIATSKKEESLCVGSVWRCSVEEYINKDGILCLRTTKKANKNEYARIVEIDYQHSRVKLDVLGIEEICTIENLLEYFEPVEVK